MYFVIYRLSEVPLVEGQSLVITSVNYAWGTLNNESVYWITISLGPLVSWNHKRQKLVKMNVLGYYIVYLHVNFMAGTLRAGNRISKYWLNFPFLFDHNALSFARTMQLTNTNLWYFANPLNSPWGCFNNKLFKRAFISTEDYTPLTLYR